MTYKKNVLFGEYANRLDTNINIPGYGIEIMFTMSWFEIAALARGREPRDCGFPIHDRRKANHLVNKGFIQPAITGGDKMFCLRRVGIKIFSTLLEADKDRPEYHKPERKLDKLFPHFEGCTDLNYVKSITLTWGQSSWEAKNRPETIPPVAIEQILWKTPYKKK